MNPKDFPTISGELINELEARFPSAIPSNPRITLSEINRLQGNQEVVNFLRVLFARQEERALRKDEGAYKLTL